METVNISLPEHIKRIAEARASQAGYATVDAYVASLIEADEVVPLSKELEAEMLVGLASKPLTLSAADWEAKRARLRREFAATESR